MKALLIGGNGYIGRAFQKELHRRYIRFTVLSRSDKAVDLRNFERLRHFIQGFNPDIIINCAGVTGSPNVDWCESHPGETVDANVIQPILLAHACRAAGVTFAHVSSGCIYNGPSPADPDRALPGWMESDPPNFSWRNPPCSFYSGSKALAEEHLGSAAYIWRLRMPFDNVDHPKNLITKLLTYPVTYDSPPNSLSNLEDAAFACIQLWETRAPMGTYNVVNPGSMTNREVVALIQKIIKPKRGFEFEGDKAFYETHARAPRSNCILSTSKLAWAGVQLPPVEARMADCLDRWKAQ